MPKIKVFLTHQNDEGSFENFSRLVDWIVKNDIKVITPDFFLNNWDKDLEERVALLTFDDGYEFRDNRFANILRENSWKALNFVIPMLHNMREVRAEWDYWLKNEDVFEVGSHSLTHTLVLTRKGDDYPEEHNILSYYNSRQGENPLPSLTNHAWDSLYNRMETEEDVDRRIQAEICVSKMIIERSLGRRCRFFSYPWGEFNSKVQQEVISSGYQGAFATWTGDDERFSYKRVLIESFNLNNWELEQW